MASEFEIKVPFKPIWTEDAKKFVDRVKKDIGNVGVGGKGAGGGISGGIGGAGGLTKLLGPVLGTAVVAILAIAGSFKTVLNIAKVILKVLGEFLRPIADVIMLMLLPVLQILKPILMIVRQIMAPFRKAALQLSAEGGKALREGRTGDAAALFGLSIQTGLAGLNAVVLTLFKDVVNLIIIGIGEFVKVIVDTVLTGFAFVVGIFSSGAAKKLLEFRDNVLVGIDETVENITDTIDGAVAVMIGVQAKVITELAEKFGVDLKDTFLPDVVKVIENVVVDGDNSIWAAFRDNLINFENEVGGAVDTAFGNVVNRVKAKLAELDASIAQQKSSFSSRVSRIIGGLVRSASTIAIPIFPSF